MNFSFLSCQAERWLKNPLSIISQYAIIIWVIFEPIAEILRVKKAEWVNLDPHSRIGLMHHSQLWHQRFGETMVNYGENVQCFEQKNHRKFQFLNKLVWVKTQRWKFIIRKSVKNELSEKIVVIKVDFLFVDLLFRMQYNLGLIKIIGALQNFNQRRFPLHSATLFDIVDFKLSKKKD